MEFRVGGLLFTSKFDSGNLAKVEKVGRDEDEEQQNPGYFIEPRPDYEYNVWTKPDCAGTEFENGNRSWFYFGIRGWAPNRLIKINIMNLNRQGKLYSQGHAPFTRTMPGKPRWERIRDRPSYETVDGQFILTFTYRFPDVKGAITYFAFCFPWSYTESVEKMNELDKKFAHCKDLTPNSPKDGIYYHRELLCESMDKLRIDLLTISSCHGMMAETEPRFDYNLFPDKETPRCKKFHGKRVFMLTSRVHPGETPASYVYNGFLEFILRDNDPRAKQLRKQYVFKLIPMLNPDGVQRGHYRTDQRGVNLNRLYLDPSIDLHPGIYASKSVLVYHHLKNRVLRENDSVNFQINFPGYILNSSPEQPPKVENKNLPNNSAKNVNVNINGAKDLVINDRHDSGNPDVFPLKSKENSWINDKSAGDHDAGLLPPPKLKIEPLNLSELDECHDTLTNDNAGQLENAGNESMHLSMSTCSSALSNVTLTNFNRRTVDSDLRLRLSELNMSDDCRGKVTGLSMSMSVGLDSDPEDANTEHLGNEGSEDENDFTPSDVNNNNAPHLCDKRLLEILPHESGIAFYVDLHGHASKRGCFIYGNYFESEDTQVENMLFPKLISINTAHFDFTGCNFTERNMYTKDKRDGMSKEGSGRVAIHKAIGIIHSYTLECNYNTGRMVNAVPQAYGDDGRATPPPMAGFPPKYTQAHYEDVGHALAVAAIDYLDNNPWSRITMSEHNSLQGVKDSVRRYLRSIRGGPRIPRNPSKTFQRNNSNPGLNNQNNNRMNRLNNNNSDSNQNVRQPLSRLNSTSNDSISSSSNSRMVRRDSNSSITQKQRELGPVREATSRTNFVQQRRRQAPSNYSNNPTNRQGQNQPKTSSAPVTLTMTTAATDSKVPNRQLSADQITRNAEEEKLQQLRNVNLLAIAKKGGPPSRIPLPTGRQFMQLDSSQSHEMPSSRLGSRSGRYGERSAQGYPVRKANAEQLPVAPEPPPYPPNHATTTPLSSNHVTTNLVHGDVLMSPSTQVSNPTQVPQLPNPPVAPHPVAPEQNGLDQASSESPKRRKRYMFMKRRGMAPSPKLGSGKGQKQSSATDTGSEVERSKPRRKRRKSVRKFNNQSPSSDETNQQQVEYGISNPGNQNGSGSAAVLEGNAMKLSPRLHNFYDHPDTLLSFRQFSAENRRPLHSASDASSLMNYDVRSVISSSKSRRQHGTPQHATPQHTTPSRLTVFWVD